MDSVPGFVPRLLRDPGVTLFRADDRVFEAMADGWRTQMLARGLAVDTIKSWTRMVERFQLFSPRAARLGTLHELTKLAPIAIIAEAFGYSARTIEHHARAAATTDAEYVARRR